MSTGERVGITMPPEAYGIIAGVIRSGATPGDYLEEVGIYFNGIAGFLDDNADGDGYEALLIEDHGTEQPDEPELDVVQYKILEISAFTPDQPTALRDATPAHEQPHRKGHRLSLPTGLIRILGNHAERFETTDTGVLGTAVNVALCADPHRKAGRSVMVMARNGAYISWGGVDERTPDFAQQ